MELYCVPIFCATTVKSLKVLIFSADAQGIYIVSQYQVQPRYVLLLSSYFVRARTEVISCPSI